MSFVTKLWPEILLLLQFAIVSPAPGVSKPFGNFLQSMRIQGSVSYRERMALPKDALLQVAVVDLTVDGAKQRVIEKQSIPTNGKQVPLQFCFELAEAALVTGHKYAIIARITIRGRSWFEGSLEISPEFIRKNAVQLHLRRVVPER